MVNAIARHAVSEREVLLTRVFDAPVDLVWQAWTQKAHLEKWLAPHTVTILQAQVDLRPGGRWRLHVRFPSSAEYWVGGVYREIVENRLLVMTDTFDEESATPGRETVVTVRFKDLGGKTQVTLHQAPFDSKETCDGHSRAWRACLDILAQRLAKTAA
jgi:uncharacterized protein YndB with AHSA1/START domain